MMAGLYQCGKESRGLGEYRMGQGRAIGMAEEGEHSGAGWGVGQDKGHVALGLPGCQRRQWKQN